MLSRRGLLMGSVAGTLRAQDRERKMFGDAEAYERFMGRWSRLAAPRLVAFANLPDRGRMLDVGSGTGSLSFAIAEANLRSTVLGIDPSQEYVAYALNKNRFGSRAAFEVGDAQQLRYPDAAFDAAVSLLVFNFIPDAKKALLEVRRVVKPGGTVAAAVWDYGAGMRMLRAFWDAAVSIDRGADRYDEKHMPLCRSGELSALWREGSLENVIEQPIDISTKFASFADYWAPFLEGQGPAGSYVRRLNREQVQILRTEIKRRLSIASEETPFVLTARVWAVRGTVPKARIP